MTVFGEHVLSDGDETAVAIGPLRLRLRRGAGAWWLEWGTGSPDDDAITVMETTFDAEEELRVPHDADRVSLVPLLADRSVVVRPATPLSLLPRDSLFLYVSTPLWIQVQTTDERVMLELPSFRSSDTWFGPSTMEGELCYAGRTRARLQDRPEYRRHSRPSTAIRLNNRGPDALEVGRIRIPVPTLELFRTPDGGLSTSAVAVTRNGDDTSVEVGAGPPDSTRIAMARRASDNRIARALGALLR